MKNKYLISAVEHDNNEFSISVFNREVNSFEIFENIYNREIFYNRVEELAKLYNTAPIFTDKKLKANE